MGILEDTFNFKVANYTGNNAMAPHKGSGNARLALISTQKIFLFLGDLGRYKEQVNETTNYGKCRQWYIKSHEINPKNGKPYNQLAVLAVYSVSFLFEYGKVTRGSNVGQSVFKLPKQVQ